MLITFEGLDGSGKTTQAELLFEELTKMGHSVCLTREPGGTELGNIIRDILLGGHNNKNLNYKTELLLFNAARSQHIQEVIAPALQNETIVICDRYIDSTIAYQGFGQKELSKQEIFHIEMICAYTIGVFVPDITFFIDITFEESVERNKRRSSQELNHFDSISKEFYDRIYWAYKRLVRDHPYRFAVVNGIEDIESIHSRVTGLVLKMMELRHGAWHYDMSP